MLKHSMSGSKCKGAERGAQEGDPGGWYKLTVRRLVNEKPRFMLLPIPIVVECGRPGRSDD